MPQIKFRKRFNHRISETQRVEYKAGQTYEVKQEIADAAAKAGAVDGGKADKAKAD